MFGVAKTLKWNWILLTEIKVSKYRKNVTKRRSREEQVIRWDVCFVERRLRRTRTLSLAARRRMGRLRGIRRVFES